MCITYAPMNAYVCTNLVVYILTHMHFADTAMYRFKHAYAYMLTKVRIHIDMYYTHMRTQAYQ